MEHADKLKTISYWGIFLSCFSDFSEKCIHAAPEHVLVYVYSGEQIIEDRNKKIKIKAGECAFIRRNHRLLMYKNSKDPTVIGEIKADIKITEPRPRTLSDLVEIREKISSIL